MISPHGRLRESGIFKAAVDLDRERRARGIAEPERERNSGRHPTVDATLLDTVRPDIQAVVQRYAFGGG